MVLSSLFLIHTSTKWIKNQIKLASKTCGHFRATVVDIFKFDFEWAVERISGFLDETILPVNHWRYFTEFSQSPEKL